jgi:hypothetical protein
MEGEIKELTQAELKLKREIYNELFKYVKNFPNNYDFGSNIRVHIINTVADLNCHEYNPDQGLLDL